MTNYRPRDERGLLVFQGSSNIINDMERIYYPSRRRVLLYSYIFIPIAWLFGYWTLAIFDVLRGRPIPSFNWEIFITYSLTIFVFWAWMNGIFGEKLAIKITSSTISGPIRVGRDEPIRFDEIDYEKTRRKKRIYSIRGDQLRFDKVLFDPKDVAGIWKAVHEFEAMQKRN